MDILTKQRNGESNHMKRNASHAHLSVCRRMGVRNRNLHPRPLPKKWGIEKAPWPGEADSQRRAIGKSRGLKRGTRQTGTRLNEGRTDVCCHPASIESQDGTGSRGLVVLPALFDEDSRGEVMMRLMQGKKMRSCHPNLNGCCRIPSTLLSRFL